MRRPAKWGSSFGPSVGSKKRCTATNDGLVRGQRAAPSAVRLSDAARDLSTMVETPVRTTPPACSWGDLGCCHPPHQREFNRRRISRLARLSLILAVAAASAACGSDDGEGSADEAVCRTVDRDVIVDEQVSPDAPSNAFVVGGR